MQQSKLFAPLKILSYVVLLIMLVSAGYTLAISLVHWSGIGV